MIIDLTAYTAAALLLLRIIIAIVFFSSGKSHVANPVERGKSIGLPPAATTVLGIAEIAGAISIAFGVFTQVGAVLLMCTMLGAMYKKIVVWNTGFYAKEGYGWHYDLLLFLGCLVLFTTAGGMYVLY
ncbi:DoxX family protein [Flavobacterium rhizosphaerae]|uniref:DoxX family protein n=1 Tax=Flavobacterium rhizosphaerae TaxID=3163298 RepID=A0ABW8Z0E3_9FLAO